MALVSNCAEGRTSRTTVSSGDSGGVSGTALTTHTIGFKVRGEIDSLISVMPASGLPWP